MASLDRWPAPRVRVASGASWGGVGAALAALIICLLVRHVGQAQSASAGEPSGYREAIRAAIDEYDAQSYIEAHEQFRRAHALYPNARTLRGLGLTEYELHNYAESVRFLEQALASEAKPLEGKTRLDTEAVLQRARGYVARVELELDPPTTSVAVDGHVLEEPLTEPLLLSIGDHVLEFSATGRLGQRRAITLRGGETQTLRITLPEEPVAGAGVAGGPIPGEREPARTPAYKKWWLWTIVGVAVAGGVVGTMFALRGEREEAIGTTNTPGALSTRPSGK